MLQIHQQRSYEIDYYFKVFLITNAKYFITFLNKEISSDLIHNYDFLYQESSKKDNLRAATAHFT